MNLTKKQIEIKKINKMSHYEMCSLWRFGAMAYPYFDSDKPYYNIF